MNDLGIQHKIEDKGVTTRGRLSANEFNQVIDLINAIVDVVNMQGIENLNDTLQAIRNSITSTGGDIPTKVSQLLNDAGYVDTTGLNAAVTDLTTNFNKEITSISGRVDAIIVPTTVSQLANDAGYFKGIEDKDPGNAITGVTRDGDNLSISRGTFLTEHQQVYSVTFSPGKFSRAATWNPTTGALDVKIPANTSQLNNDADFATKEYVEQVARGDEGGTGTYQFNQLDDVEIRVGIVQGVTSSEYKEVRFKQKFEGGIPVVMCFLNNGITGNVKVTDVTKNGFKVMLESVGSNDIKYVAIYNVF